ncbi:MAG: flagellar biosynthesis anti-sigma factor FlgM [SAR324 cluster bacterium]|nr:flagellar biosynthesis anti-sigma factor FlgM [SAR324 cluster bacterium]
MKIQGHHPKLTGQEQSAQVDRTQKDAARIKPDQLKGAKQALKSDSSNLTIGKMRQKINLEPDINADKVKALRERIKSGSYKVDTAKLAANLMRDSSIEDI